MLSEPRAHAKSNGYAEKYPAEFELIWEHTGRRGGKFQAFKAWEKVGKPSWVRVEDTWRAYLLSERPVAGFVKDLSSWLNGRCHQQEWEPAQPRLPSRVQQGRDAVMRFLERHADDET